MAESPALAPDEGQKPRRKKALVPVILLALLGFSGGFAATYIGADKLLPSRQGGTGPAGLANVAFLPLDPILVNINTGTRQRILRFSANLEVEAAHRGEIEALRPRILDIFNTYLRAVDPAEFDKTSALSRLRAQLLRRLQVVTGEGRIRDLLITEFIIS